MILKNNFFGMLGLAVRSRGVLLGTFACDKGVKSGKVELLIVDDGASKRTKKDMKNMCEYFGVRMIISEPAGELAHRCGKDGLMVAGVTDGRFAHRLVQIADSENVEV